ncbi:LysR family transcriptional regulator [uncultured Dysosmobacter sp.]|uniref:LysR family transcriptional regulator n=1 Tax=uncultured Dysosmobacter sp. TaxID=2591384 RepID=UPI00262555E4|nr:LysR family transcriptional regulator [uncultured Dysosmobacter sp.]
MELSQLRYFKALAENGNLTKTASKLYISPPALSTSISNLEKELGISLFDRVGRRMYLNSSGILFLKRIDNALSALDYAKAEVMEIGMKKESTVYVASTSPNVFQNAFLSFWQENPNYKISHESLRINQINCKDLFYKYDFLIASPMDFICPQNISSQVLYDSDYAVLVVNPAHPLANLNQVCLREVKNQPFIALSPQYSSRHFFDVVCHKAGFIPHVIMECDYSMRFNMVMAGAGNTIATAHTKLLGHLGNAVAIKINPPFVHRVQCIFWDKTRHQNQAASAFLSYITEYFKNMSFETLGN